MHTLFLTLLRMSMTASLVILIVLVLRVFLRRIPKIFSYVLWAAVLFRLFCPVAPESPVSLIPSRDISMEQNRQLESGPSQTATNNTPASQLAPDSSGDAILPEKGRSEDTGMLLVIMEIVWLSGCIVLLLYGLLSLLRLRRQLAEAVPVSEDRRVMKGDHIQSPFVIGVFRPQIFMPSHLSPQEREYILLHEHTHIRHGDHIFRTLAWLALVLHWFNPLVWLAFYLAGKDMEMCCDETVLGRLGQNIRADYAASLLRISAGKRLPSGPLAFGNGELQSRITNVLQYKKAAPWLLVPTMALVLAAGTALITNRAWKTAETLPTPDLNRNGIGEELRVTQLDGEGLRLEILENGETLFEEEGYFAHTGWNALFLCTLDGRDYLLRYEPVMTQGNAAYSYELFTLENGQETTVQSDMISFDIHIGSPIHSGFAPEEIASFMETLNGLLSQSIPLINTDENLLKTFEEEGKLMDNLWWLDHWESKFVRDPSKSLLENLRNFQAAMEQAQP